MGTIHLTSEEFANRIERGFALASKGNKTFIAHNGQPHTLTPMSDEEPAKMAKGTE